MTFIFLDLNIVYKCMKLPKNSKKKSMSDLLLHF